RDIEPGECGGDTVDDIGLTRGVGLIEVWSADDEEDLANVGVLMAVAMAGSFAAMIGGDDHEPLFVFDVGPGGDGHQDFTNVRVDALDGGDVFGNAGVKALGVTSF